MLFCSVTFLFLFLPAVYLLYLLIPRIQGKNALLLIASILFYTWGEGRYVILMFLSVLMNWCAGLLINRYPQKKKTVCVLTVTANLVLLAYFKYIGLFLETVNLIPGISLEEFSTHLPVGISFFTFQALSYVIDVARGQVSVQKNFGKLFLYISFFPQLIAGPIVKYYDIAPQLELRKTDVNATAEGIRRFIIGLAKKLLLADGMAVVADSIFSDAGLYGLTACAWLGAAAYLFQIYFDFSGYSDMAIGLGKMFGFTFKENFNYPYGARGIQDFWRKWHISLSTWFREYLYIPLGGNRKGRARTCFNILIVFSLTGLWHGANYTFIIWGLYNGILLVLERLGVIWVLKGRLSVLTHMYTVLAVLVGFVIFRADSLAVAGRYLASMFRIHTFSQGAMQALSYCSPYFLVVLGASVIAAIPVVPALKQRFGSKRGIGLCFHALSYFASIALFICCVMALASNSYSPFIYFRF